MSKYNSKIVEYNGIAFDSKMECDYYKYLEEKVKNGEIRSFSIQPKFVLIPKFEKLGNKYREMTYTPDFSITNKDGSQLLVDIKGFGNQTSELRKKLFDYTFPFIELQWISYSKKYGGWILYEELIKLRKLNKREK